MANSPMDNARGAESQQIYLLTKLQQSQKRQYILLAAIYTVLTVMAFNQCDSNKALSEDFRARNEFAKAQLDTAKAMLQVNKETLEADDKYRQEVLETFKLLFTRLGEVEQACTTPAPR